MLMETEQENERASRSPSTSERDVCSADLITSFSNPNYNIEEDILNCNVTTPLLEYTNEEILNRLEGVVSLRAAATAAATTTSSTSAGDGEDAKLTTTTTTTATSSAGLLAYYKELAEAVRLRELESRASVATAVPPTSEENGEEKATTAEEKKKKDEEEPEEAGGGMRVENKSGASVSSPDDSLDSGIQSEASAGKTTSAYDLSHVVRRREKKLPPSRPSSELPEGWEKYEDEEGPYYWHVKTGTIQRAQPTSSEKPVRPASFCSSDLSSPSSSTPDLSHLASLAKLEEAFNYASVQIEGGSNLSPIPSETSSLAAADGEGSESLAAASAATAASVAASARPLRFSVRSLGWAVMADEELTPERSSQSVNRCIVRMAAAGRRDLNESAGTWGEGQDLVLELTNSNLLLLSSSETVLHKQAIMGIKVWGVGRENNRDFAYVSRDRVSRKYHCHVFRCEQPARHLANTLCSLCKHLVLERKRRQALKQQQQQQHQQQLKQHQQQQQQQHQQQQQRRPMSLPGVSSIASALDRDRGSGLVHPERGLSFPTPMEEPKKILRCQYIGCTPVKKPIALGIEILNDAIEKVRCSHPRSAWTPVTVTVAPSTVKVVHEQTSEVVAECRVRFLVFMGISMSSVQLCGFIVHTAQNSFICHVLFSEPTCGPLCKTIEAACTLRYQKCLDAHNRGQGDKGDKSSSEPATTPSKRSSIKEGLQSMWAAMSLRKSKP